MQHFIILVFSFGNTPELMSSLNPVAMTKSGKNFSPDIINKNIPLASE
jgi:hypothetical protein